MLFNYRQYACEGQKNYKVAPYNREQTFLPTAGACMLYDELRKLYDASVSEPLAAALHLNFWPCV